MSFVLLGFISVAVVFVGALIGAIGIGGVLLVPILTLGVGVNVHIAIATAMFAYLFTGIVGAVEYARRGSIDWATGLWLCLGGMPGAYLGAMTTWLMPAVALELLIGILVLISGVHALRPKSEVISERKGLSPTVLVFIGVLTGFGSAITGTGGPLVLVPILLWLKVSTLTAVGLSQIIQIPIALLATGGNLTFGHVDFKLGFILAAMLVVGVVAGANFAHRASKDALKRIIAMALLGAGTAMLVKVVSALD